MAFTEAFTELARASLCRGAPLLAVLAGCSVGVGTLDAGTTGSATAGGGLGPGAACQADSECAGAVCLGHCCANPCMTDPAHPECSSCDAQGACAYPAVQCVAASCDPLALKATQAAFCANGLCATPTVQSCAASCDGTQCGSGCRGDQDCAAGDRCVVADGGQTANTEPLGTCVAQAPSGGPCLTNEGCASGVCLAGVCCATACANFDPAYPECTSCGPDGACQYSGTTSCGNAQCDSVANAFSAARTCKAGTCPAAQPVACGTYLCGAGGCSVSCLADLDCASSGFCVQDHGQSECCPVLVSGATLYADILTGSDVSCCGLTPDKPCRTIARALEIAGFSEAKGRSIGLAPLLRYTLQLTVNGGAGDWQSPPPGVEGDVFDSDGGLQIPSGVTLHAPGVSLGGLNLFDPNPPDSGYYASLEGAPGSPLVVGLNGLNQLTGLLQVASAGEVRLSNVILFDGLTVSGGDVRLGVDSAGAVGGTVQLGWAPDAGRLNGSLVIPPVQGILLEGGTLTDFGNSGDSILRMYVTDVVNTPFDLFTVDGTAVNLSYSPLFIGGNVGIASAATLNLSNAVIANQLQAGIYIPSGNARLDHVTVDHCGCQGIAVGRNEYQDGYLWGSRYPGSLGLSGGSLQLSNSTLTGNNVGLQLGGDEWSSDIYQEGQLADLRYGPDGGPGGNRIYCNGTAYTPPGICPYTNVGPGANIWNSSAHSLLADNVAWGPTLPTAAWLCDIYLTPTSCTTGSQPYCDGGILILPDGGMEDAGPLVCGSFALPIARTPDLNVGALGGVTFHNPTLAVTSCP